MRIQFIWVVFTIIVTSCWADKYFSAPRSESGFGSKRLLHSYASYMSSNSVFKIEEYNEDLSFKSVHVIRTEDYWWDVQACDQFYLALSIPSTNPSTATLVLLIDDGQTLFSQTNITMNITKVSVLAQIAVAPSGRNFVFMNGTHLIVFEIDAQKLNWAITEQVPLSNFVRGKVVMSDSKIGFVNNDDETIVFYNYKNHTFTTLSLHLNIIAIDTYDDYWLFTSNNVVALENPNGQILTFNFTFFVSDPIILPLHLRKTREYVDVATSSTRDFFSDSPTVTFGTLNTKTMQYEPYTTLPSKSLGLLINPAQSSDSKKTNTLLFGVSYNAIIYQIPNQEEYVFTFAVPSLPGNHSCAMHWNTRLDTFWCSTKHIEPTSPCPKGTYQPSSGMTTCLLCPDGTYQPKQGSIQCLPCLKEEFCPLGTYLPEVISNVTSHVTWDFPITEAAAPSFEEILLMLLFASSVTSNSISIVLLGCSIITAILLISLLIKHCWGINLHQWLAKIDIHKKTKYKTTVKPSGSFKTEAVKVESVFGGYLTLLAGFILLVGLITTIIFVNDYHPLLVGDNAASVPSHNSVRAASLQDYNTQSKASELANVVKNNYHLNISFTAHNTQDYRVHEYSIHNCYDQYGQDCFEGMSNEMVSDTEHTFSLKMKGSVQSSQVEVNLTLSRKSMFTWASIEIQSDVYHRENEEDKFQPSSVKYLVLPGDNQVLSGLIIVPVTMTVVVRETQIKEEEFNRHGYMSFVADQGKLHNMGHSAEEFERTNDPITIQLLLELDNNWRLESEQQRFGGVGAFFAALLAILGLYEVTLLASELAHRVFHSIEKRHKKRSKYEVLEEGPLIINEKSE